MQLSVRATAVVLSVLVVVTMACGGGTSVTAGSGPGVPPRPPAPLPSLPVQGWVVDPFGDPVSGARVRVQGSAEVHLTDAAGRFDFAAHDDPPSPVRITAGRAGYFNAATEWSAGQPTVLELTPAPGHDNPDYRVTPSYVCRQCHPNQLNLWRRSGLGKSGVNPWVHDLFNGLGTEGGMGGFVYQRDSQELAHAPNGDCASCHAPVRALRDPGHVDLGDPRAPVLDMLDGVSCEVCHKVADVDLRYAHYPGIHPLKARLVRPVDPYLDAVMLGPLDDAVYFNPPMRPAFAPVQADGATLCALCHEYSIDHDGDGDHEDEGSVPCMTTWSEWRASRFGAPGPEHQSCIDCHLSPSSHTASTLIEVQRNRAMHAHDFPRAGEALAPNHGGCGGSGSGGGGGAHAWYQGPMSIDLNLQTLRDGRVLVVVDVTNSEHGHAMPTGSPIRSLLLRVEAEMGGAPLPQLSGSVLDETAGVGDPATGHFAGLPGMVYARVLADGSGRPVPLFTEAKAVHHDTRIQAGATDRAMFVFGTPGTGVVRVKVQLLYRRIFRAILDSKGWTLDANGSALPDLTPPAVGRVMGEVSAVLRI